MEYIDTQPGSGKTHYMINEVLITHMNVKHLIVQPTIKLQEETYKALTIISEHVKVLNTETKNGNLLRDIRAALRDPNVRVLLISEPMFYMLEPEETLAVKKWMDDCIQFSKNYFTGISSVDYEEWSKIYSSQVFEVINQINNEFNEVKTQEVTTEMSDDVIKIIDSINQKMRNFNKLAVNNDYINNPPKSEKQKRYITLVGWHDLSVYENHNMIFMANNFEASLLYKYNSKYFKKIDFQGRSNIDKSRLDVRYFVPKASLKFGLTKAYTESEEGVKIISKAVAYINNDNCNFYCTENIYCPELAGEYYPPNLRGVNSLMHHSTAVFFSCMNATPVEMIAYKNLFGFSSLDIKIERELEVLDQFCKRGVIRRRDVDTKMVVYVLSEDQALYLSDSPTYIDLSIVHKVANKGGQEKKLTKDEKKSWNAFKGRCTRGKKATGYTQEAFDKYITENNFSKEVKNFLSEQFAALLEKHK